MGTVMCMLDTAMAAAALKMDQRGQTLPPPPSYPGSAYAPISGMSRQVHALSGGMSAMQSAVPGVPGVPGVGMQPSYPFSSYHSMFTPSLPHDPSSLFFSDITGSSYGYHNNMYGSYMNGMGSSFFRYMREPLNKEMTCEWLNKETGKVCRKVFNSM